MIKHLRSASLREEGGQNLVEFATVVFLLIIAIFGVVEMCRLVLVYTTVANGARIGTRYAIVHGSHSSVATSQIQSVVNSYLHAGTINTANATVTVTYPDTSGCTNPGCRVTVSVSYPYDVLTSYLPIHVTLRSSSEGVITF